MSAPKGSHFFHLTDEDKEDIRRLTLAGKSAKYIAEWIGCTDTTVRNHRKQFCHRPRVTRSTLYSDDDLQQIIIMYNTGVRASKIASHFGRSKEAIYVQISKLRAKGLLPAQKNRYHNGEDSNTGNRALYTLRVQPSTTLPRRTRPTS